MSFRAIILGMLMGVGVASFAFFNDEIVRQTRFIGNYLPISVIGGLIMLLMLNVVIAALRQRWALRPVEIAVIAGIALAGCAWPTGGFSLYFSVFVSVPNYWQATQPHWHANHVMSYVPGGAGEVALGHVQDWPALSRKVQRGSTDADTSIGRQLWAHTNDTGRHAWQQTWEARVYSPQQQSELLRAINTALGSEGFFADELVPEQPPSDLQRWLSLRNKRDLAGHERVHLNRALLAANADGAVMPAPRGGGILLSGGRDDDERYLAFVHGDPDSSMLDPDHVNWAAWAPPIMLWGGTALLLGLATVCLALIVHPQWAHRELLPYPISQFITEISARPSDSFLPTIARNRLFWGAFASVLALHLLNGISAWFPVLPSIPLNFDFSPLRELFPNASRSALSHTHFEPHLYLTVVAFAFFIPANVSFSLGICHLLFMALSAMLISQGVSFGYGRPEPVPANFLRFGAFAALAVAIFYNGRRYYLNVAGSALGLARLAETPAYAPWAARIMVISVLAAVGLLASSGFDWTLATIFVLLALLTWLVLSRIVCETGAFGVSSPFMPIAIMLGLLGFEALGPTGLVLVGLASWVIIPDPRESLMPYVNNALHLADRHRVRLPRLALSLGLMSLVAAGVAIVAAISVLHRHGALTMRGYTVGGPTRQTFNSLVNEHSEAHARMTLAEATAATGLDKLTLINPDPTAYGWMALGVALVAITTVARLRLPGWPLHPVIFLIWGTWGAAYLALSFLLGWIVRTSVVRLGGAQAFHQIKPFMVGVIAGELLAGLFWVLVGAAYYFITGQMPQAYSIFPPRA